MTEVIRAELQFDPVGGDLTGGRRHDARVVDHHVDRVTSVEEQLGEVGDR